jgi:hypothetical protein
MVELTRTAPPDPAGGQQLIHPQASSEGRCPDINN